MKYKIELNLGRISDNYCTWIFRALKLVEKKFDFEVLESLSLPYCNISVNGDIVAYIAHADGYGISKYDWRQISKGTFRKIFKFHYSPNLFDYSVYGDYKDKIIPCGIYRWFDVLFNKNDILLRDRYVDVVALMRPNVSCRSISRRGRKRIIEEANKLSLLGYDVRAGKKIPLVEYIELLSNTKIGFHWQGTAYLGWKIPEFTQQGVVMICEPLGINFPFANDVIFEDNIHCIFCNDPNSFGQAAIDLLGNKEKLTFMRKNVIELWENKFSPEKVGEWWFKKIVELCK